MATTSKNLNPYTMARQEWDERYGDLISRARNWRRIAFLSMSTTLVCVTGMVTIGYRSHTVPYVVALATGVVDQVVTGYIRRREPRATIDAVRMGRKKMFVSSGKAERDLGWRIVPVDDALRRAVAWFQSNGYA